jgi:hypothetical protein
MVVKRFGLLVSILFLHILAIPAATAGDFEWLNNLNIKAEADSSGFRFQLASRFRVGDATVNAVIGNVAEPSDAYMIFRLGELSHHPVDEVMKVYRANRHKGWGVMARDLGIKPGSREFHALKRGEDLDGGGHAGERLSKHGNGHGHGRGHR